MSGSNTVRLEYQSKKNKKKMAMKKKKRRERLKANRPFTPIFQ